MLVTRELVVEQVSLCLGECSFGPLFQDPMLF
jgi:hypothetical protein